MTEIVVNKQNIERYFGRGFNQAQLDEIEQGIEQGVNVELYADPNITAEKMNDIRKTLYAKDHPETKTITFEEKYSKENEEEFLRQKMKSQQELGMIAMVISAIVYAIFIYFILNIFVL